MAMAGRSTTIILDRPGRLQEELDAIERRQTMREDEDVVGEIDIDYLQLLRACIRDGDVRQGRRIHAWMRRDGLRFSQHRAVGNQLVQMYLKCGSLEEAMRAFDELPRGGRNLASWNAILAAIVKQKKNSQEYAMGLYAQMRHEGLKPNKLTLISVLKAIDSPSGINYGRAIHCEAARDAVRDAFLATAIFSMYARCGRMDYAQAVFNAVVEKDIVAWNAMLSCCGTAAKVFAGRLLLEGAPRPNEATFIAMLTSSRSLQEGQNIHSLVMESGCIFDVVVATAIVTMYGRHGSMEQARALFDEIETRNVVSWNAMIAANASYGDYGEAILTFRRMQLDGIAPNRGSFVAILKACCSGRWIEEGRRIHTLMSDTLPLEHDELLSTALLTMYGARGWNAMLAAYSRAGDFDEAMDLFLRMTKEQSPNDVTFSTILSCCGIPSAMEDGRLILRLVECSGLLRRQENAALGNAILAMHAKCGRFDEAEAMFEGMKIRDEVSWNTMIRASNRVGRSKEAMRFFHRMQLEGIRASAHTLAAVLDACGALRTLEMGKRVYELVTCGELSDSFAEGALVAMYGKCGCIEEGEKRFQVAEATGCGGEVALWRALIGMYTSHGMSREAAKALAQMRHAGVRPDRVTLNAVAGYKNVCVSDKQSQLTL